jgi:hypothetical protein
MLFLYLLTVLNTLSTDTDDTISYTSLVGGLHVNNKKVEFDSRGRRKVQNIINLPIKSFRIWLKK